MTAEFPSVPDKYRSPEVITAAAALSAWQQRGIAPNGLEADAAVMVYDRALAKRLEGRDDLRRLRYGGPGRYFRLTSANGRVVLVSDFGIGAPVAAAVAEALIAGGVERIVSIGTAGGLQPSLRPGDVVGVTGAVRDDGTSWHYLPGEHDVAPDPDLAAALFDRLGDQLRDTGSVWTTDAIYRETVAELQAHRAAGVLAVEMEAAALMAVCAVRGVEFASAVCISDLLDESGWLARFDAPVVTAALDQLFESAVETLRAASR